MILGLGLGWYVFGAIDLTYQMLAWVLIILGAAIAVSGLFSRWHPNVRGLVGAFAGGLVISLFIISGQGFIGGLFAGGNWPYSVEDTKSYSGLVTVDRVYLKVESFNGPVTVSTWDRNEYRIDVRIQARGYSQADAEARLRELKAELDESLIQGERRVSVRCEAPFGAQSRYGVEVEAVLPAEATISLDLESSNGPVSVSNLRGTTLKISTTNAMLTFSNVRAVSIDGSSSNGRIEGDIEAEDVVFSTSNGRITLRLPCSTSGDYKLSTSNAAIELHVSNSPRVGYDVDLSTSNADIGVNLPAMAYSQNDRTSKEARTQGFGDKAIQVLIEASTSNARIDLDTD